MNVQKASFIKSAADQAGFINDGRKNIVFAGRSNVGKSSVINSLLNRKNFARVGNTPGKTVQINYFLVDQVYFVDLPGYGFAKVSDDERRRWGTLMEDYFAKPERITLGILVVDSRHLPTADDITMCEYFVNAQRPFVVVANKIDKLKKSEIQPNLDGIRNTLQLRDDVQIVPYSCLNHTGTKELLGKILSIL